MMAVTVPLPRVLYLVNAILTISMNPYLPIVSDQQLVTRKRLRQPSESPVDDTTLFARFLDGDDAAFMELFDRHAPRLGKYCRRMIGDARHAEDLLQDLWEKVVRMRDSGKDRPHNPLGLLYWMARNLCLNYIRDHRNHLSLEILPESEHPVSAAADLSHLEEMVILALERLPLEQREVLILHTYSGYTLDEIAQMMGDTHGAIRTRAWRARRQLKRIIAALVDLDDNSRKDESSTREDQK